MSTTVNEYGFTPFTDGRCQSLKVNKKRFTPFDNGGCQILPRLTSMGSQPLLNGGCQSLLYSQRVLVHTLC